MACWEFEESSEVVGVVGNSRHLIQSNSWNAAIGTFASRSKGANVKAGVNCNHFGKKVKYRLLWVSVLRTCATPDGSTNLGNCLVVDGDQVRWLGVDLEGLVEAQSCFQVIGSYKLKLVSKGLCIFVDNEAPTWCCRGPVQSKRG